MQKLRRSYAEVMRKLVPYASRTVLGVPCVLRWLSGVQMSAWESREGEDTSLGGSRVGGGVWSGLGGIGH